MAYSIGWVLVLGLILIGSTTSFAASDYVAKLTPLSAASSKEIKKAREKLDSKIIPKIDAVFEQVFLNDDKKAKLAYGRGYRFMPEFMQFALDLRFRNFEHALSILPKSGKTKEEIDFWTRILTPKPPKISAAICEDFKKNPEFPSQPLEATVIENAWAAHLLDLGNTLAEKQGAVNRTVSLYDEALNKLTCTANATFPPSWQCEALSPELIKELLNDGFFDKLHNMQRRDIRWVKDVYRNHIKLARYNRYISHENLFKFHFAIEATQWERHNTFSRRYKGFARDMRTEDLISRVMGDVMLDDQKDLKMARRLHSLIYSNPILALSTRMEWDLVNCDLPATKN